MTEQQIPAIDALFADWDRPGSPGAALLILDADRVVYKRGYGSANLEYGIPITPETIFHVASVSKQFTCMAIALLADEGKLSLDDEIHRHLPELPDFGHPISIRHLVHHTSGLRDQWELLRLAGWRMDDVITRQQILRLVGQQRGLNFVPGSEHLYCNTGYTLMAEIVERVSGQPLRAFAQERIFAPLGMSSTHFHDDHEEIVPNRAYSYKPNGDAGFRHAVLSYANVGATSLFTTVEDLAKWSLNFEQPVVGSAELMAWFHEPFTLTTGKRLTYAFGLNWADHRGVRLVGHGGADAGFRSVLVRFPEHGLAIVILANLSTFTPQILAGKVAEAYLGARAAWGPESPPAAPPAEAEPVAMALDQLQAYAGSYYSEELDVTYRITAHDGGLTVVRPRLVDLALVPVGAEAFSEKGLYPQKVRFVREGDAVTGLLVDWGRVRDVRFVKR